MWRLTIEQTTKKKFVTREEEYNSTENVVFESECIQCLLLAISGLEHLDTAGQTKYILEEVKEGEK